MATRTDHSLRTVRELGGEIWAALGESDLGQLINWQVQNDLIELVMGVLARHDGVVLQNDEDLPVDPLPRKPRP